MINDEQRAAFIQLGNQHAEDDYRMLRKSGGMSRRARQERATDEAYELMTRLGVAREDRIPCLELVAAAMVARHRELEDEDPGVV